MNGIEMEIRKCLHIIKYDPVYDEYRKAKDEFSRGFAGEIERVE